MRVIRYAAIACLVAGCLAAPVAAGSLGTMVCDETSVEMVSALGVLDAERPSLKIYLLSFEPSEQEIDQLVHDEAFWMDDGRESSDPDRFDRPPYAHYSMSWSFEPDKIGNHDKATIFIYTSGWGCDNVQLNLNMLPGEISGKLSGSVEPGGEVTLVAADDYTLNDHHLTWDLNVTAKVYELQEREEEPAPEIERTPEQMPLEGSTPEEKAAIEKLTEKYGEASMLTFPWCLNPRSPEDLKLFLQAGVSPNAPIQLTGGEEIIEVPPLVYTLSFACDSEGTEELVDILLDEGADVNAKDPQTGATALMLVAVWEKCTGIMKRLLDAGADPNITGENGDSAMTRSLRQGSLEQVQMLIDGGYDIDSNRNELLKIARYDDEKLKFVRTAKPAIADLGEALDKLDVAAVKRLLAKGATAEVTVDDEPPLIYLTDACRWKDKDKIAELIILMLENGADHTATGGPLKSTPLNLAAQHCPANIVSTLIEAGADPNVQDAAMKTPLFQAVFYNRPEIAEVLLKAGAKPDRNTTFFARSKPEINELLKKYKKKGKRRR